MDVRTHDEKAEERKEEKRREKRARVLKAAEKIFLDKGFHAASMSEIAEKANISTPHLYNFYESKAALALAVQEKMSKETFESMTKDLGGSCSDLCPSLLDSRRSALVLTILTECTRNPEIAEKVKENGEHLLKMICQATGMSADDKEDQYRILAVMALYLGMSISLIFRPMDDRELLAKIMNEAKEALLKGKQ